MQILLTDLIIWYSYQRIFGAILLAQCSIFPPASDLLNLDPLAVIM